MITKAVQTTLVLETPFAANHGC